MGSERQCANRVFLFFFFGLANRVFVAIPYNIEIHIAVTACYRQLDESGSNDSKCLILSGNAKATAVCDAALFN